MLHVGTCWKLPGEVLASRDAKGTRATAEHLVHHRPTIALLISQDEHQRILHKLEIVAARIGILEHVDASLVELVTSALGNGFLVSVDVYNLTVFACILLPQFFDPEFLILFHKEDQRLNLRFFVNRVTESRQGFFSFVRVAAERSLDHLPLGISILLLRLEDEETIFGFLLTKHLVQVFSKLGLRSCEQMHSTRVLQISSASQLRVLKPASIIFGPLVPLINDDDDICFCGDWEEVCRKGDVHIPEILVQLLLELVHQEFV